MLKIQHKDTLGVMIIRYVLGIYTIITILITVFLLKHEYDAIRSRIVDNIIRMEQTFYDPFTEAIWGMDRTGIKSLLSGLVQSDGIVGLRFTLPEKVEFASIGKVASEETIAHESTQKLDTEQKMKGRLLELDMKNGGFLDILIEDRFELWRKSSIPGEKPKLLGIGSIFSSNEVIIEKVKHGFYIIIVSSVIKTIVIWILFFVVINALVSKPLNNLTGTILSIDPAKPMSDSLLSNIAQRKDELGVFAQTFKQMIVSIHDNIDMINDLNQNLEKKVAERTQELAEKNRDIEIMLSNIKQGIFTFDGSYRIQSQYSKYLESIFETQNVAGMDPIEFLFKNAMISTNDLDQMKMIIHSCIGLDEFAFSVNAHLLVRQYNSKINNSKHKIIELDWSPILDSKNETILKVMVVVRDVTEIKRLEEEIKKSNMELAKIGQILSVGSEKFISFYEKSMEFLNENKKLLASGKSADDMISVLFRNLHTIKGNARTLQLTEFVNCVHEAEQLYQNVRDKKTAWNKEVMDEKLASVTKELAIYWDLLVSKLKLDKAKSKNQNDIINEDLAMLIDNKLTSYNADMEASIMAANYKEIMNYRLNNLYDSLQNILQDEIKSLTLIAPTLGKKPPMVHFAENVKVIKNKAGFLKDIFTHLLRNSLDHGLETAEQRVRSGKKENGNIYVNSYLKNKTVFIHIKDDGSGLNLLALKKKAQQSFKNDEEYAELIFQSGVSTANQVSEISGRGVGLDAVRGFLEKLGGSINLVFVENAPPGEYGHRAFEFIIAVPLEAVPAREIQSPQISQL